MKGYVLLPVLYSWKVNPPQILYSQHHAEANDQTFHHLIPGFCHLHVIFGLLLQYQRHETRQQNDWELPRQWFQWAGRDHKLKSAKTFTTS